MSIFNSGTDTEGSMIYTIKCDTDIPLDELKELIQKDQVLKELIRKGQLLGELEPNYRSDLVEFSTIHIPDAVIRIIGYEFSEDSLSITFTPFKPELRIDFTNCRIVPRVAGSPILNQNRLVTFDVWS